MERHAFLIIAHNEPEILKTLMFLLDHPQNDIFIHIDRKTLDLRQEIENISLKYSSLHILERPISVCWGDISQVKVEFLLFEEALKSGPYLYYHLLSGVDLPIKNQDEIHDFFSKNKGNEFVGFWTDKAHLRDLRRKAGRYHFFTETFKGGNPVRHNVCAFLRNVSLASQKTLRVHRNKHVNFKKGFNWVSITHEFCSYLVSKKKETLKIFRFTLCPDEIFLQTVLWNSPFKDRIYNYENTLAGSLRYIDWERGNPYIWNEKDVDELLKSPYLFARKFSSDNFAAVEKIKERLSNKN